MPRVLICEPLHATAVEKLRAAGFEVVEQHGLQGEELACALAKVDAAIVRGGTKVTKEVLAALPSDSRLKLIVRAGVGLDNIDLEAAKERGIKVFNTPRGPTISVAELTLGLMLALARRIAYADHAMKEKRWVKWELRGTELRGKRLGIVGLGRIGSEVARLAKAFGMEIIAFSKKYDPRVVEELEIKLVELDELLKTSDFVSLHVPLTPETHHMIGERELRMMKPTAFLINTARGAVVDSKALLRALEEEWIAGAGLDVFEEEPPTDWRLVQHPKVVATPHIGAQTEEARRRNAEMAAEIVIRELSNAS